MSVLLIGLDDDVGAAVIEHLVRQGDEVRVVENHPNRASRWRGFGAYVARGDDTDADLVMRAATNCRTIVALGPAAAGERLDAAVDGAGLAGVERVIIGAPAIADTARARVRRAGLQFVLLTWGKRRPMRGAPVAPADIAAAVDAADDLSGEPALDLDLCDRGSWAALGLRPRAD